MLWPCGPTGSCRNATSGKANPEMPGSTAGLRALRRPPAAPHLMSKQPLHHLLLPMLFVLLISRVALVALPAAVAVLGLARPRRCCSGWSNLGPRTREPGQGTRRAAAENLMSLHILKPLLTLELLSLELLPLLLLLRPSQRRVG